MATFKMTYREFTDIIEKEIRQEIRGFYADSPEDQGRLKSKCRRTAAGILGVLSEGRFNEMFTLILTHK